MGHTLGTCKVCGYWKRHNEKGKNKKFGQCKNEVNFRYEPGDIPHKISEKANALIYSDYEGYSADFETGENFGCIFIKNIS